MEIIEGELWSEIGRSDLILVTTNSVISSQGELVMGAGAALSAKQRFPSLPRLLAAATQGAETYGIAIAKGLEEKGTHLGGFQTKRHFKDSSPLSLIELSAESLAMHLDVWSGRIARPDNRGRWDLKIRAVALNFPGIALGGLSPEKVLPILEKHFKDRPVRIYRKSV